MLFGVFLWAINQTNYYYHGIDWVPAAGCLLALANALFLFSPTEPRVGRAAGRLRRMAGLWMDAKEHELKSRVPPKGDHEPTP